MAVAISNDFLPPEDIVACLFGANDSTKKLERQLKDLLNVEDLFFTNSGTHALKVIFSALRKVTKKKFIAIAAYSCPDIAVAAILSGFEVYALEVDPSTLEPQVPDKDVYREFAAVVLSNLYGLTDNLEKWRAVGGDDTLIVDDACQSFLSSRKNKAVGSEAGTIGAISFARGKPLPGVGGGAIVLGKNWREGNQLIVRVVKEIENQELNSNSRNFFVRPLIKATINWIVTRSSIFDLLLKLPIDLGNPTCREKIEQTLPSNFELGYLLKQTSRSSEISAHIAKNCSLWHDYLATTNLIEPFIMRRFSFNGEVLAIRYPVVFRSPEESKVALTRLREMGVGATAGYRQTLQEWSRLSPYISSENDTLLAKDVSKRIVLLPTHSQVKQSHIESAAQIFRAF